MKKQFNLGMLALLATAVLSFASCKDKENNTIVNVASDNQEFSILVQALTRANLATTLEGNGPFTVFAPTNDAFNTFLSANGFATLNDVPVDVLTQVLLNHVVSGKVKSTDLTTGYVTTLAKYGTTTNGLSMYVDLTTGVRLNGVASVTQADIEASNGVIHKVDAVIGLPTVVTHAAANPNFTTLVSQVTRTDFSVNFATLLSSSATPAPFTVFAPTNAAFTALEAELGIPVASLPASAVENVLKYHVVGGANVRSTDLTNGQVVTTLASGKPTFTVNISGNAVTITDDNTTPRTTNVVATDVQCSNGVIHVLDRVLLNL